MQSDFAKVKLVPIGAVLAHYKIPTRKRNNTELVANCPFKSHTSKEHSWTLAISTHKNKWYCHSDSCREASNRPKGGDVIDLISMLDNVTGLDAAKKLAELFALGNGTPHPPLKPSEDSESNPPLAFALKLDPEHPAIQERKITVETAREFGVGFHSGKGSMANRICFPIHESGQLVGYAGRTVLEVTTDNPKWKLPLGLKRTFLFNLERCVTDKTLYLLESPWACLWFHQHWIQAVALIGTCITEAQEKLLEPFGHIHICMDNDAAGHEAAQKIYERLKGGHTVTKAYLID